MLNASSHAKNCVDDGRSDGSDRDDGAGAAGGPLCVSPTRLNNDWIIPFIAGKLSDTWSPVAKVMREQKMATGRTLSIWLTQSSCLERLMVRMEVDAGGRRSAYSTGRSYLAVPLVE